MFLCVVMPCSLIGGAYSSKRMVSEYGGLCGQVGRKFHDSREEVEPVLANKNAARVMSE